MGKQGDNITECEILSRIQAGGEYIIEINY